MRYFFDLSKPKVIDNWVRAGIVYTYEGKPGWDWQSAFEDAVEGRVPGINPPREISVSPYGDDVVFHGLSVKDLGDTAEFIYKCSRYASTQAVFREGERLLKRNEEERRKNEFYAQFDQVPGPPA